MTNFKENEPQESIPIMIQKPEQKIKKCNYLDMEAHTFLIKEIAEIELNKQNIDEIIWYQLG